MRPLVSVIIPVYNHQDFLLKCLESVANETYDNIEILIIDDGSTDDSFQIAQTWSERNADRFARIELHRQENLGVTKTLNRLVQLAKGEFIAVLASDDCLLPGGIEARVNALGRNSDWLAVFGDCVVVDENETLLHESGVCGFYPGSARKCALLDRGLIGLELALRWSVPGPVFLMRRQTPEIIGEYDETISVEDKDYYLRLLTRGALGFIDHKVASYRLHGRNACFDSKNSAELLRAAARASEKAWRDARGLLRLALLADYRLHVTRGWQDETGLSRIWARSQRFAAKVAKRCLAAIQGARCRRREI